MLSNSAYHGDMTFSWNWLLKKIPNLGFHYMFGRKQKHLYVS